MDEDKIVKKITETPAKALDGVISVTQKATKAIGANKPAQKAKEYWEILGPGLTTGASDDDPSGIATYSQTGARYGFQLLWLSVITFPLMSVIQEMCARIGLVTGRGLAANIRKYFPKKILYMVAILLFASNSFNIGADLGAMAKATQLLVPKTNFTFLIIGYTIFCLFLEIFLSYKNYAKVLKYLALVLFSYVFSTLSIKGLDWGAVLHNTIFPNLSLDKDQIILICAILGTTISPYLFFWQTSQEVEEEINSGQTTLKSRQGVEKKQLKDMRTDVWSGMLLSNLAMFFIITACAGTLHLSGITNISTAEEAAAALRPFAGDFAYLLFAVGIIGVGLLGVPVLAGSASYAISEGFGLKGGLNSKLRQAYSFYGVLIISMLVGLSINFIGLDPIKALVYSAVFNGIIAPVALVLIVLISSNTKIMGEYSNGLLSKIFGWITVFLMSIANVATLYSLFI